MYRCNVTGVKIALKDAYVLDIYSLLRKRKELQEQLNTLNDLYKKYSKAKCVEDPRTNKKYYQKNVISRGIAEVFNKKYKNKSLFVPLTEFKKNPKYAPKYKQSKQSEAVRKSS